MKYRKRPFLFIVAVSGVVLSCITHQTRRHTASSICETASSPAAFLLRKVQCLFYWTVTSRRAFCALTFFWIGEFGHRLLKKSLQMLGGGDLWIWIVEQQFIFAIDIKGIKTFETLVYLPIILSSSLFCGARHAGLHANYILRTNEGSQGGTQPSSFLYND